MRKNHKPQPAVLLINDLPTWGRVALASAVPILESAGFQACCLPTALLSTHGAYPGFVLQPQTAFLRNAWSHLASLNLHWDAVAVGLVGDREQFPLIEEITKSVRTSGGLVLVDPILGDNGRRYGLFPEDYVSAVRSLVSRADVITPNLTEAALLLGERPDRVPESPEELDSWIEKLAELGPSRVVVTSAPFPRHAAATGVAWYDRGSGAHGLVRHRRLGQGVPGTGDVLAARLLAELMRRRPFPRAVERAVKRTFGDLKRSRRVGRPPLWGPEGPLLG